MPLFTSPTPTTGTHPRRVDHERPAGNVALPHTRPARHDRRAVPGPQHRRHRLAVQRRHELADFERQRRDRNPQLAPGMLVIFERAPYRVVEIREYPSDLWPQQYQDRWDQQFQWWLNDPRDRSQPEKETWRDRPVVIVLQPDGGGEERHLLFPASRDWDVLPEHYAVCRSCGELPPCREEEMDRAVDRQMAKSDRLMAIPAGNCMGCGEAISTRQKTVAFPGPNLWRPDLPVGTARFHARGECSQWVDRYRKQWQAQGEPAQSEQPSLFGGGEA